MYFMNRDYEGSQRYDLARFLRWHKDMYDALDSVYIRELRALSMAGSLIVLTQAFRPDLLAYDIYRDVNMWTVPMLYNGLTSEEEIVEGLEVRYPSLGDIESLYFRMISASKTGNA